MMRYDISAELGTVASRITATRYVRNAAVGHGSRHASCLSGGVFTQSVGSQKGSKGYACAGGHSSRQGVAGGRTAGAATMMSYESDQRLV